MSPKMPDTEQCQDRAMLAWTNIAYRRHLSVFEMIVFDADICHFVPWYQHRTSFVRFILTARPVTYHQKTIGLSTS